MPSARDDIPAIWARIAGVLERHVPHTARTLAHPATDREIAGLESAIGLELPTDFRQSLKTHNGQDDPTECHSFIIGSLFASTSQIAERWRLLTDVDERFRQEEPDWDAPDHGVWWNRHWVPFTIDSSGDSLCINLNPEVRPGGTFGEIVCHLHDSPHEPQGAPSYGAWLERLAQRLENGEFTIDDGYLYLDLP